MYMKKGMNTGKGMWSLQAEISLLEQVRECRYLWDHKDQLYNKQSLRKATFQKIADSLREDFPLLQDVTEGES